MKHLILLIAIYFALATQSSCGAALSIGDCRPPLMWLPVVLALTWSGATLGVLWAVLIGLLADGLAGGRFGIEMFSTTMAAVLMMSIRPDEDVRSARTWWVWWFAVIVTGLVLSKGLHSVLSDGPEVTMASFVTLIGEAVYGLLLCGCGGLLGGMRTKNTARFHHA